MGALQVLHTLDAMRTPVALVLIGCVAISASVTARSEEPVARDKERAVQRSVLSHVVSVNCQTRSCIPTLLKKGVDRALLADLARNGKVLPLERDDFKMEDGATRAFRKRSAQILDVGRIRYSTPIEAIVDVRELTTAIGSRTCIYRLNRVKGIWVVDEEKTLCSS